MDDGYPSSPCGLPGSSWERATPVPSLFGLAPGGGCQHPGSPRDLVGSYPTVSPLPDPLSRGHRRSRFCGPIRDARVTPDIPGCYPAPCPLELGLSSSPSGEATTRTTTHLIIVTFKVIWCQGFQLLKKLEAWKIYKYVRVNLFILKNTRSIHIFR